MHHTEIGNTSKTVDEVQLQFFLFCQIKDTVEKVNIFTSQCLAVGFTGGVSHLKLLNSPLL